MYGRLRSQLLQGRFRPGERLKIAELCAALSGNLSAVREALARLTAEGLVISEPQRGYRVAPISAEDLRTLTEARVYIESRCVELSIQDGDIAWESGIVAALHRLSRTPYYGEGGDTVHEWVAVYNEFHRALVSACNNSWLLRIRESLSMQSERYRWFSVATSDKKRNLDNEHREIADAFLTRNVAEATKLITRHIERTSDALLEYAFDAQGQLNKTAESVSV